MPLLIVFGMVLGGCSTTAASTPSAGTPSAAPAATSTTAAGTPDAAATAPVAAAKPVELVYSTPYSDGQPDTISHRAYFAELEKRTNGQVKVKQFNTAGALLKAADTIKGIQSGMADTGFTPAGFAPADLPLATFEVAGLTHVPGADAAAMTEIYETYAPFKEYWHKLGLEVLYFQPAPVSYVYFTKQINSLDDIKGKKVRSVNSTGVFLKNLGMVPVEMAGGEVYTALQTGLVEGFTGFPVYSLRAYNMLELTKEIIDGTIGIYAGACPLTMNLEVYNKLPEETKAIIKEMRTEWIGEFMKAMSVEEVAAFEAIKESGVKMTKLTDEQRDDWLTRANPDQMLQDWIKDRESKGAPAAEFVERYIDLYKKYEPTYDAAYETIFEMQ